METNKHFTTFAGFKQIAAGDLKTVLISTREYLDKGGQEPILIFDDDTGRQIDFNLQGTLQEVLDRNLPQPIRQGPGRPKLGVVSREISLLPRHWEWLDLQPRKASATIRRLIESARKNTGTENRAKQLTEAAGTFMWSIAGDFEGFEEATRALYAGNWGQFRERISAWSLDIRHHLEWMLQDLMIPNQLSPGKGP